MSDKFNKRQQNILTHMNFGEEYAFQAISRFFGDDDRPSVATLGRDIADLCDKKFLKQSGERRGTRYRLTSSALVEAPIIPREYLLTDVDERTANTGFNFDLFQGLGSSLFLTKDKKQMNEATQTFQEKSNGVSYVIRHKELERFVIELSWKSSKIEGNTYTLLDTERLIREGIEATGHTRSEAIMILNHKKAFQFVLENQVTMTKLSVHAIEDIHRLLVEDLGVSFAVRTRSVGITGSLYTPLALESQIKEALTALCQAVDTLQDSYSKAFLALVGLSYIQPFEDGNKRTARLVANALLLAYGCAPLSYRSVNEVDYRESMLVFYEKNSIVAMRDIFIQQYLFSCEHYLL